MRVEKTESVNEVMLNNDKGKEIYKYSMYTKITTNNQSIIRYKKKTIFYRYQITIRKKTRKGKRENGRAVKEIGLSPWQSKRRF